MMVVALGSASLFSFSIYNNSGGSDRATSMAIAQEALERLRSAEFSSTTTHASLVGGTTVQAGVLRDGRTYSITRTIDDNPTTIGGVPDVSATTNLKSITITVMPDKNWRRLGLWCRRNSYLNHSDEPERISKRTCKTCNATDNSTQSTSGFSLLELLIAMTITLAVMAAASTLLATSLRTRTRENQRSNALAAAQRALNIMSREIGNSGYGLTDNGIVVVDSDARFHQSSREPRQRADLNQANEDVRFVFQDDNDVIVRVDNTGSSGVLAGSITGMGIQYLDVAGVAQQPQP